MPVEIREIIIRTEVSANGNHQPPDRNREDLELLKRQLLEECKKFVSGSSKKNGYIR